MPLGGMWTHDDAFTQAAASSSLDAAQRAKQPYGSALGAMGAAQISGEIASAALPQAAGPFQAAAPGRKTVGQGAAELLARRASVGAKQGPMPDGTTLDAATRADKTGNVTGGKESMDAQGQAIMDYTKAFNKRIDDAYNKINGIANPWDTSGEAFQQNLIRATNDVTRAHAGNQQRLLTQLGQRGQLGGAGATAALASLDRHRGQALSDARTGLYQDALARGTAFEADKARSMADLATGNFQGSTSALQSLLNNTTGNYQFDKQDTRADKGLAMDQARLDEGIRQFDKTFASNESWRAIERADKEKWLTIAQQNNLDARESQMWGNLIGAAGPTLAKGVIDIVAAGGIQAALNFITGGAAGLAPAAVSIAMELLGSLTKSGKIKGGKEGTGASGPAKPGGVGDFWMGA